MKHVTNPKIKKLLEEYKHITLLNKINGVLDWDLNVNLPSKAANGRAQQVALLAELVTNRWLDPKFKDLFESIKHDQGKLSIEEKAIVRNLERSGKYYFRVPKDIIIEEAKTTAEAFMVWQEARRVDKFLDFLPYLERIIKLDQVIAQHLGFKDNPYDALLDLYEPNLTANFCQELFDKLQPNLTQVLKKIQKSPQYKHKRKDDFVNGLVNYPTQDQKQLSNFVLKKMGYDLEAGRLDIAPHPFTIDLDFFDVRITTRYNENDFRESLTSTIHEAGHALYEQGVNIDFNNTPLSGGVSLGIHESQSRFWENQIGRSKEFLEFLTPVFQAFFQEQLGKVGSNTLAALFNEVKPSLIRVEADEVTYNLHIILRFEIENALINGKLKVKDVPEVWRSKMKKYLGIIPDTDRDGVLQDIHWSQGSFGYFPTYTLGNLYAAQFTAKMKQELNLEQLLQKGELGTILSWLRENIHQYGSLYWPNELVKKVTGEGLNPQYFLDYIQEKYSKIY